MNLPEINVLSRYVSKGDNNLVDSLIKPALKCSCMYRRSVAFFSSSVLKLLKDVLPDFYRRNGKIRLIVSPELNEDDIKAIQAGYDYRNLLDQKITNGIVSSAEELSDSELQLLIQLISNRVLDIKVAIVKNHIGIYHDKLGIFSDVEGNHVVFYGSANSSMNAYRNNYEIVRSAVSWLDSDNVNDEIKEFDDLWENRNPHLDICDFVDSVEQKLLKVAEERALRKKSNKIVDLYDYQKEAIDAWFKNGNKGFFVMATGTGKTWTAIFSAKRLYEQKQFLLVITAPYKHLIKQWEEDVTKLFPNAKIILISSENPNWETEVRQEIVVQKHDSSRQIILISTIKSFQKERFDKVINCSVQDKMLIVDEAHRFTQRKEKYHDTYKYLLGLSATPENGKNVKEGKELINFFGGQVYNLPLEDALAKNFLVQYKYYPIFVHATEDEEERFSNYTKKIASCFSPSGVLIYKDELIKYLRERLGIIAKATEKLGEEHLEKIFDKVPLTKHLVVYCGDGKLFAYTEYEKKYIRYIMEKLGKRGVVCSKFTASESMDERMQLVKLFDDENIDALVAIRCLDEGINIPSIENALILSSNDDYREFVQRRGRILRKDGKKIKANIYDVVVLPSMQTTKMAEIELRRVYEYAHLAQNRNEIMPRINHLLEVYNLTLSDIQFFSESLEGDLDE